MATNKLQKDMFADLAYLPRAYAIISISGTNVTLESESLNIASVVRNSTGNYTITYDSGLGLTANKYCLGATYRDSAGAILLMVVDTMAAGSCTIELHNSSGVPTDLAEGLYVTIFSNH